jgi:ATP-dependent helicase YprA (DUF1998 family)/rubrerythrin
MALNPISFTDKIVGSFLRYQLTSYPFADRRLDTQMRNLLSLAKTRATPLLNGPYLTLSRPFNEGCTVQKLIDDGVLHPAVRTRIPDAIQHVYLHQEEAIRSIMSGRTTLVSTGTGSGKSECFLYPVISRCFQLRDDGVDPGISAVIVYPMNALAEDQLLRLRSLLAGTGIPFGMYVGKTPRKKEEVTGVRLHPGASRADYEAAIDEARRRGTGETVHPSEEVCSREEMQTPGRQPRILLTNVNQLELLLTRQKDIEMFDGARLDFLVYDEAHTFTGAQGAETACLNRRLLRFCGKAAGETTCVATSATILDPRDPDAALNFASRFFGTPKDDVTAVGESYAAEPWKKERWVSLEPHDPISLLATCVEAVEGNMEKLRGAFAMLSGRALPEAQDLSPILFEELAGAETLIALAEILRTPCSLTDGTRKISEAIGRKVTEEELLSWLILGAFASKESRPLVRPVVHAFLRGIGGATVSFPDQSTDPVLHFSAGAAVSDDGYFRLHLSTCTTCGQHYFSSHLRDFKHVSAVPEGGQLADTLRYWEPLDHALGGDRCILIDELVSGEDLPAANFSEVHLCRKCGTIHQKTSQNCAHCGVSDPLVPLKSVKTKDENPGYLSRCLGCDSSGRRVGGAFREPARPVKTSAVADIHVLAQDMINHLDPKRLLVFCDNRQDAAFQAGWMRDHARRFRLRSLIADELRNGAISIADMVLSLSRKLAADISLSKALIPEVWRVASDVAKVNHGREREKFLRFAILREITLAPSQMLGLEPWGRLLVSYKGLNRTLPFIINHSRILGIAPDDLTQGIAFILDSLRRRKVIFDSVHKTFSKFWRDGDLEMQNGYLPTMDPPKGTKIARDANDKKEYVVQWQPGAGETFIRQAIKKWGVDDADIGQFMADLFDLMVKSGWLIAVSLEGGNGRPLPQQTGLYQVNGDILEMEPGQGSWKCARCSRKTSRKMPHDRCPAWRCSGQLEFKAEDPDDYNLSVLDAKYDLIRPEEHTAMVPAATRERIENKFKDISSTEVNTLVCTQTLEMGVDIGSLDAVLMRNVPPLPANYWQRAGRAGRRNRMAVDITYCRDMSHDRAYFSSPERLLAGRIDAPSFNLSNPLMVRRHIHACILSRLHAEGRTNPAVGTIIKSAFPASVKSWLFDGARIKTTLPDLAELRDAISARRDLLLSHIRDVFAAGWPTKDSDVVSQQCLEQSVDQFTDNLLVIIRRLKRRLSWAHETVHRLNRIQADTGSLDPADESVRRRCERYIKKIKGEIQRGFNNSEGQDDTVTYSVLAMEGFLPGYGLERGSILGEAEIPFWESRGAGDLKLPRPHLLALREYVPGNLIYANGHRFKSRKYHLEPAQERENCFLQVAVDRSSVREVQGMLEANATSKCICSMPMSDVELIHISQVTDEEDHRFQMGVAILGMERPKHSGGWSVKWGERDLQLLKGLNLRMANVGASNEIQRRGNFGYLVCEVCGDTVSPLSSDAQKANFRQGHRERCGQDQRDTVQAMGIHADLIADALRFPDFSDQTEAYSVLESIRMAATSILEMSQDDLQVVVIGEMESSKATGYLIDPMPGGSGLLEQLIERWKDIRARALEIADDCPSLCSTSCSECLQNYRNSFYHKHLDRNRAKAGFEGSDSSMLITRQIPALQGESPEPEGASAPVNDAERRLRRLLQQAGFPEGTWGNENKVSLSGGGYTIPDVVIEPLADSDGSLNNVAIYLDGMSRGIHGNAEAAARDALLRARLRETVSAKNNRKYEVVTITSHDLGDPVAMTRHFKTIARHLELDDIRNTISSDQPWFSAAE